MKHAAIHSLHARHWLRSAIVIAVIAAGGLVGAIVTGAVNPSSSQETPTKTKAGHPDIQPLSGSQVTAAELFPGGAGYAVTDSGLLWTQDFGDSWTTITPPGISSEQIADAEFLADRRGWVAVREGPPNLSVFRRDPSVPALVPVSPLDVARSIPSQAQLDPRTQADIGFVDETNGWLLVRTDAREVIASSAILFRTQDGGVTWEQFKAPAAGQIRFTSPTVGYLIGGPARSDLFVSSDAGETWTKANTPDLASHPNDSRTLVGEPMKLKDGVAIGVSWITKIGRQQNGVGVLLTNDDGKTWSLEERANSPEDLDYAFGAAEGTSILALFSNRTTREATLSLSTDSAQTFSDVSGQFSGLVAPPGPLQLSLADATHLWLVGAVGSCRGNDGTDCFQSSGLFKSDDGGKSWEHVELP